MTDLPLALFDHSITISLAGDIVCAITFLFCAVMTGEFYWRVRPQKSSEQRTTGSEYLTLSVLGIQTVVYALIAVACIADALSLVSF